MSFQPGLALLVLAMAVLWLGLLVLRIARHGRPVPRVTRWRAEASRQDGGP